MSIFFVVPSGCNKFENNQMAMHEIVTKVKLG